MNVNDGKYMKVIYFTTAQVVFITAKIAFIFTVGT